MQCLAEVLPAIWWVTSFLKLLSHSCPIILLNTNVPVICHWVLPLWCSRGSPHCWDRNWTLAGDWCEWGVKKNPEGETTQQENHTALTKQRCKISESKGEALLSACPFQTEVVRGSSDCWLWKAVPSGHCCWAWQGVLERARSKFQLLELSTELCRLLWILTLKPDFSYASSSEIPPAFLVTKILGRQILLVIVTKQFSTSLQRMPLQAT